MCFGQVKLTATSLNKEISLSMFRGVRQLDIDLSLVIDLQSFSSLNQLTHLQICSDKKFTSTEIAASLKLCLRSVKDFRSRNIAFSKEEQLFLAYFLSNAKFVEFFGTEALSSIDFSYFKGKLPHLRGVHLELCENDLEGWSGVLNNYFRRIVFHVNMVDKLPNRFLHMSRPSYSSLF